MKRTPGRRNRQHGASLVEVVLVLGLVAVAAAAGSAGLAETTDRLSGDVAARSVAARLRQARVLALRRGTAVGVRFLNTPRGYAWQFVADGNGNGVRTAEIGSGVDPVLEPPRWVRDDHAGVAFGVPRTLPAIEGPGQIAAGSDPIVMGSADLVVFSPLGTATSGTLYFHTAGGTAYAARVLGTTGRVRTLRFDPAVGWVDR
jgi:type II secretory pathway pseudopilin PulG